MSTYVVEVKPCADAGPDPRRPTRTRVQAAHRAPNAAIRSRRCSTTLLHWLASASFRGPMNELHPSHEPVKNTVSNRPDRLGIGSRRRIGRDAHTPRPPEGSSLRLRSRTLA